MKNLFKSQRRDLNLIALSLAIWSLGEGFFMIFQPIYLEQLGANPIKIGFIISLSMVVIGFMHMPVGLISDHVSRKSIMVCSWVVGTLAALIMGFAQTLTVYVLGLLLYSITGAVIAPMNSYISDCKADWSDHQAFTYISASFMVGYLVGPLLGGLLAERIGLRPLYFIATLIFSLSTSLIFFLKDQPVQIAEGKPSARSLLRNRQFMLACLLIFGIAFTTFLPNPLTSNFLHNERGVSLQMLGIFGMVSSLGGIIFNLVLGKMHTWPIFFIGQTAVMVYSLSLLKGQSNLAFGFAYIMWGGYRVINAITSAVVRPLLHNAQMGFGFGLAESAKSLALVLAPILAGYLYNQRPSLVYEVSIALGLGMLITLFLIGRMKDGFFRTKK
ncbi:MAG: MFS transporter [Anaerolineaceae bacterium]|nr:MFS transporter [Anaerolineaceae bacterium]